MSRERVVFRELSAAATENQNEKSSLRSYASQTAETLGVSKRSVEIDLARAKKIDGDVLASVAGTEMDKGTKFPMKRWTLWLP